MPVSKGIFTLFSPDEFTVYLNQTVFSRNIRLIQNHHTYLPAYAQFKGDNAMAMLEGMRHYHLTKNKWPEIGQNLTTFPDGKIALCRPIHVAPAGIKGANTGGICIEHVGNFDVGGDNMTQAHRDTIVYINAVLCKRFNLKPNTDTIVYHHWYDLKSGKRTNGSGITKTCPGTNFFKGNTVTAAEQYFIPEVMAKLNDLNGNPSTPTPQIQRGQVTASSLRVRDAASASGKVLRHISRDAQVDIFFELNGWYKISAHTNEWVAKDYIRIL